jgi:hypothetical protein
VEEGEMTAKRFSSTHYSLDLGNRKTIPEKVGGGM